MRAQIKPTPQAPNGLQNPSETKAFAIENQAGKWSINSVPIGNNFAHTLRDGSQHLFPEFSLLIQWDSKHALKLAASQSNLIASEIANRI